MEAHSMFTRESVAGQVICGSLAAAIASGLTNPLDVRNLFVLNMGIGLILLLGDQDEDSD